MRRFVLLVLVLGACSTEQTDPPPRGIGAPVRDAGGDDDGAVTANDGGGIDQDGDTTVIVGGDSGSDSGPPPRVDPPECTANPPTAPANGLTLIAYGLSGFSGTQGKCGWRYGYIAPATSTTTFTEMMQYDGAWHVQDGTYWTTVASITMHPNGLTTSGGRTMVDHFAVRRWVSNYAGMVHIAGIVKKSAGATGGNGTLAHIVLGGTNEIYSHTVIDETGVTFDLTPTISVGLTIDFELDPNMSDDGADSTDFDVRVWR